jgi:hypothetical protein
MYNYSYMCLPHAAKPARPERKSKDGGQGSYLVKTDVFVYLKCACCALRSRKAKKGSEVLNNVPVAQLDRATDF